MSYEYDDNGNMEDRDGQSITWDEENRAVEIDYVDMVYDGDGNRVKRTEGQAVVLYINQYYERNISTGIATYSYFLGSKLIAQKEDYGAFRFIHQDSLSSTTVATDGDGELLGAMNYYPFGDGFNSQGDLGTDRLFTGQRYDATGLYYYGARYYDWMIGRFISPDTTIPDGYNPQSYNRYSYCINNPTSAIDPSGLDYIFVCGSGGKHSEWDPIIAALNIDPKEVFYVDDTKSGPGWEMQDQVQGLTEELAKGHTDIKIVGHSEGAAATAVVLDQLANDSSYLANSNVREELTAAFLLDAPTGISDYFVGGPDINSAYNNLPSEVHAKISNDVIIADIWNTASVVHSSGYMPGWKDYSHSYDSRSWWEQGLDFFCPGILGYSYLDLIGTGLWYHNDPLTSDYTYDVMYDLLGY